MQSISKISDSFDVQSGFTLIELLVTIGILAVGMLGVSAMQINALRGGQGSIDRGEVALLASSMAERMRANTNAVYNGDYDQPATDTPPNPAGTPINATDVAKSDWNSWMNEIIRANLGGTKNAASNKPKGAIACADATGRGQVCTLTISWNDQSSKTAKQLEQDHTSADTYTYTTTVIF